MLSLKNSIGSVVAADFRTAAVFSKYKIDFCCNGNRTIEKACIDKNVNSEQLIKELTISSAAADSGTDFMGMPSDVLADYIETRFHAYIRDKTPVIRAYLDKLCKVHGSNHPELHQIKQLFFDSADELELHMRKEEGILFPYIRQLSAGAGAAPRAAFGTIDNPVNAMKHDHDVEGNRFRAIAQWSNDYETPEDACGTYRVAYAMLQEFERELHQHIHLENNILFPKAQELEKSVNFN